MHTCWSRSRESPNTSSCWRYHWPFQVHLPLSALTWKPSTYCICHNINIRHHNVFGLWDTLNFSSVTGYLCNVIHAAGEPWLIITCPLHSPSLIFQAELWSPVSVAEMCSQTLGYRSCPPIQKGLPLWSQAYVDCIFYCWCWIKNAPSTEFLPETSSNIGSLSDTDELDFNPMGGFLLMWPMERDVKERKGEKIGRGV